jgi:ethanolamine utilization protein EutN
VPAGIAPDVHFAFHRINRYAQGRILMLIGRVIGDIVASRKHASHEGMKLLLVAHLDLEGNEQGAPFVAVDSVSAGVGDRVLLAVDGWAAMTAVDRPQSPIDAAVLGIIDHVDLIDDALASKAG